MFRNTITRYRLQRGEFSAADSTVLYTDVLTPTGITNSTQVPFIYGSVYYFRIAARNEIGEGPMSDGASILAANVPNPPTRLIFNLVAPSASSNQTQLGIKWSAGQAVSGDAQLYHLQMASAGDTNTWVSISYSYWNTKFLFYYRLMWL